MEHPDRTFLDVMRYAEDVIPPPDQFDSSSDLVRYLERVDRKSARDQGRSRRLTSFALEEMVGSSSAIRRIMGRDRSNTALKELSRAKKVRVVDESKTVKKPFLLAISDKNVRKWQKNPARFDLKGVDTKTHSIIKEFIRLKTFKWKERGHRVVNDRDIHVFTVRTDKKGRLYAMNVMNGKRVGKRVYGRFGTLESLRSTKK